MYSEAVLFYDGYHSYPRQARIEVISGNIYLLELEASENNALVFPVKKCKVSFLVGRLFLYPPDTKGSYIVVEDTHAAYPELSTIIKNDTGGWFEKLIRQRWYVLVILLVSLISVFYILLAELLPSVALRFISPEQESVFGEKLYQSVIEDNEIDSASTYLVQEFADQISLSKKYRIRVTVVKDKEINAFALPGGHIVVYTGILKVLDRQEELAALLGHEATHINQRHSLQGILSGLGISLLESILFNGMGAVGDQVLHNANSLRALSYSRKLEREADEKGMELMIGNGMNPVGMKNLMINLQKSHKSYLPAISFISTHPLTEERIKNADGFILRHKTTTFADKSALDSIWSQLKHKNETKAGT